MSADRRLVQSAAIEAVAKPLETAGFRKELKKRADMFIASNYFAKGAAWMEYYAQFTNGPVVYWAQLEACALLFKCSEEEAVRRIQGIQLPTASNVPRTVMVKMAAVRLRNIHKRIQEQEQNDSSRYVRELQMWNENLANKVSGWPQSEPEPFKPWPSLPDDGVTKEAVLGWMGALGERDSYHFRTQFKEMTQLFTQKPGSDAADVLQEAWNMVLAGIVVAE